MAKFCMTNEEYCEMNTLVKRFKQLPRPRRYAEMIARREEIMLGNKSVRTYIRDLRHILKRNGAVA